MREHQGRVWNTVTSELEIPASLAVFLNLHLAEAAASTEFSDKPTKPGQQLNTVTSVLPPLCSTGQQQCTQGCTEPNTLWVEDFR